MEMKLYTTNDGENVVNKQLSPPLIIDVVLKADTNINSPVILINTGSIDFSEYNYCSITELGRYYFIDDIEQVNNRIIRLSCSTDVLMTYKQDILASHARVRRSIKNGDYMNVSIESSIIKTVNKYLSDKSLSDNKTLILTTVGE